MSSKKNTPPSRSRAGNRKKSGLTEPLFRKTRLPNGIRVLTEKHPESRAVSCGLWVTKGTRDEEANEAGLAHFVEHLVFKRTTSRSAYDIARDMEAVGGDLNAFTSREYTCFVTHSLKEDLALSLDVLSDLVCRPVFEAGDIRKEKSVVLQEIHMSDDQLEDAIFDRFFDLAYPKATAAATLGRPILGTTKSIQGMKRSTILDFHRKHYVGENLILTVTGNVSHDKVLELAYQYLKFPRVSRVLAARASKLKSEPRAERPVHPPLQTFRQVHKKASEQAHILIGLPASTFTDRLRFDAYIVNTLLGGGMTSRLFQTVREQKALAYSVYSQLSTFTDAGLCLIYAGTEAKKTPTVIETILRELKKLKRDGINKADLNLFKTQVLGQILLGSDDIENRMNSIGVSEMVFGRHRTVEDVMREVQAVNLDSVHEYIETYLDLDQIGMLVMGPVPEEPTKRWLNGLA
jgi:predicted Zn-dependent peptidase